MAKVLVGKDTVSLLDGSHFQNAVCGFLLASKSIQCGWIHICVWADSVGTFGPEQGIKLLGLLLTGSTGQHMASRNGLA